MIDYGMIVGETARLKMRYGSHADPREILTDKGVALLELSMGTGVDSIKGFILKSSRMVTVGINTDLSENARSKVLFHEAGHLLLGHLQAFRAGGLRDASFGYRPDASGISRLENEANFFASDYLLDTNDTLDAIHAYDIASAARLLCVPVEFLDYKLRLLHALGKLDSCPDFLSVRSDCMRSMKITDFTYE